MTERIATPTPEQLEWADCELGVIIHLDLITFVNYDFRADFGWNPSPEVFDPKLLDTDHWVSAAADMGAKYAVLVAKHCTGFSLWPTDAHDFSVKSSPWRGGKGDVVGDFIKSCEKYGVKPGLYYSASCNAHLLIDNPGTPYGRKFAPIDDEERARRQTEYNDLVLRQLTELWTRYGKLFEIWFDGGCLPPEKGGPDIAGLLKKLQPDAVVFQGPRGFKSLLRWVGNESGVAHEDCFATLDDDAGNYDGNSGEIPSGSTDGTLWIPAESDMPNRYANRTYQGGWFWHEGEESAIIPAEVLMDRYVSAAGHNTNLLIGMNIDDRGLFLDADAREFARFGELRRERFGTPAASTSGKGASLELEVNAPVHDLVLEEDISLGERVTGYTVEIDCGGGYVTALTAKCIGHKRIIPLGGTKNVKTARLTVNEQKAEPVIRFFGAY